METLWSSEEKIIFPRLSATSRLEVSPLSEYLLLMVRREKESKADKKRRGGREYMSFQSPLVLGMGERMKRRKGRNKKREEKSRSGLPVINSVNTSQLI